MNWVFKICMLFAVVLMSSCNYHVPESDDYTIYGKLIDYDCKPLGAGELQYVIYKQGTHRVSGGPASFGSYIPNYPILKSTKVNERGEFAIIDKSSRSIWVPTQEVQSNTVEGRRFLQQSEGSLETPVLLYSNEAGLSYFYTEEHKNNDNDFVSTIEKDPHRRGLIYSPSTWIRKYSEDYTGSNLMGGQYFYLKYAMTEVLNTKEQQYLITITAGSRSRERFVIAKENKSFSKLNQSLQYKKSISILLNKKDMDKKVVDVFFRVKNIGRPKRKKPTATSVSITVMSPESLMNNEGIRANVSTSLILLSPKSLTKIGRNGRFRLPKKPAVYGRVRMAVLQIFDHSIYKNRTGALYSEIPAGRMCGKELIAYMEKLSLKDVLLKINDTEVGKNPESFMGANVNKTNLKSMGLKLLEPE